jgi:pseudouridine kinase
MSDLVVIGGAHIDRLARLSSAHRPQTSNPAAISETIGGGGFNAARAARRMGISVAMLSARGGDASGAEVAAAIQSAGITDLSSTHLDRSTPTYTAILEPGGELVTAIADMALYETSISRTLSRSPVKAALNDARAILIDANLADVAIAQTSEHYASSKPVFALAISAAKAVRLLANLALFAAVFLNRYEAATLTQLPTSASAAAHAAALAKLGVQRASVSAGREPAAALDHGKITLLPPPEITVVDVTGAGDALAGTTIASMLQTQDFLASLRLGHAAAALTASAQGPSPMIAINDIRALAENLKWTPA